MASSSLGVQTSIGEAGPGSSGDWSHFPQGWNQRGHALDCAGCSRGRASALLGLKPGDVIRTIGGIVPPSNEPPMFAMGTDVSMALDRGSQELTVPIAIPAPRSRKQPTATLKPVTWSVLDGNTGYIKVPILPGMLGLDVARTIDEAMTAVSSCDRLILDLRGHVGGGLGVLRLMSHLTPDRIPIGYTVRESGLNAATTRLLSRNLIDCRPTFPTRWRLPAWQSNSLDGTPRSRWSQKG